MSNINLDGFLDIAPEETPQDTVDRSSGDSTNKPQKKKRVNNAHRDFVLKDWLASLSLGEYYHLLFKEGFDKPLSLKVLTDEDLIEIGIKKKGHRLILLNAVKDAYFTSLSANPGYSLSYGNQYSQPPNRLIQNQYHEQPTTHSSSSTFINNSSSGQSSQKSMQHRPGQLVPLGYVNTDSPYSDSDMEDVPESYGVAGSEQSLSSSSLNASSEIPNSPHTSKPPPPLSTNHPSSPQAYSPSSRYPQSTRPPRFQEEDNEEDEDPRSPPLSSSQTLYPLAPSSSSSSASTSSSSSSQSHSQAAKPRSSHPPKLNLPLQSSQPSSHHPQSPQLSQASQTFQFSSTEAQKPRKRSRGENKPEQPTQQAPDDAPPKPKPAAITFIPKQHYSRSDIHDCLGGQRFCAISTPSAYPFILIFAHYQPYVGEDGMWEHCASGDMNKGVNRSVINAKDKKKRLLLFFSLSGQQGAVLFLGEEEKNNKGVDKACVIFKFQRINNDAITINIVDYRTADPSVAQPKPVIRSLTEDPNSYNLDTLFTQDTSTPRSNNNINNNNNNSNNNNNNNNNINNNNTAKSSLNTTTSSTDSIPITPNSPPSSSAISPQSSSSSFFHSDPSTTLSLNGFNLIPVKQERPKEEFENFPPPSNSSLSPSPSLPSSSSSITNLSRNSSTKINSDNPSLEKILNGRNEPDEARGGSGWTNSISNITHTSSNKNNETTKPNNNINNNSSITSPKISISNLTNDSTSNNINHTNHEHLPENDFVADN